MLQKLVAFLITAMVRQLDARQNAMPYRRDFFSKDRVLHVRVVCDQECQDNRHSAYSALPLKTESNLCSILRTSYSRLRRIRIAPRLRIATSLLGCVDGVAHDSHSWCLKTLSNANFPTLQQ